MLFNFQLRQANSASECSPLVNRAPESMITHQCGIDDVDQHGHHLHHGGGGGGGHQHQHNHQQQLHQSPYVHYQERDSPMPAMCLFPTCHLVSAWPDFHANGDFW
jgi:hypothetical protein